MRLKKNVIAAMLAGVMVSVELLSAVGPMTVKAADAQFKGEEWYDQVATVEVNREPAHASFTPYESLDKAMKNEKSVLDEDASPSEYFETLNGEWDFKFAQKPDLREKAARGVAAANYKENWVTSSWDKIQVPSSIQAVKKEDGSFKYEKPIYTNQTYPWANYETVVYGDINNPPVAPTVNNSVGQYKRTFTVPSKWDGREVFVNFEGVESAFYLYINGEKVGYAEDSYTTDDFNITSYLKRGQENTIALEVYRWSTGSYLENQDFIRYSGIFRDVNLYSKAKVELRDFFVKTELDDNYENAVLTLDADVRNLGLASAAGKNYTVEADLYEVDSDTKIWSEPMKMSVQVPPVKGTVAEKADDKGVTVTASKDVVNPKKWFADTPNLYRLSIQLKDETGKVVETAVQRVGFREIDRVDINEAGQEQAQINGEKIMFRGTNRHESNLDTGRAITKEDIKTDLLTMKQYNVNAIRTSHYPNAPYTYALADELGIYMCDEANVESHKGATESQIPSAFPIWNTSVMDRTVNMVERDKNHASVVIWSLGNEATYQTYPKNESYTFWNTTQWILERDPSRLRKYERDNRSVKGDRSQSMVDIQSSQYWSVGSMEGNVTNKANKLPYIQSEYAHAMGNGLGNFKEYWDVFRKYPNAQGGFIWDWIDQSLRTKTSDAAQYYVEDDYTGKRTLIDGTLIEGQNGTKALKGSYSINGGEKLAAKSNSMTLDVWVKPNETFSATKGDQAFICRGEKGFNIKIKNTGKIEFFVDGWTAGLADPTLPSNFTDGKWHRITGVLTAAGKYGVYYDGELLGTEVTRTTTLPAYDAAGGTPIGIGYDPEYTRKFDGAIDRVSILKRALTPAEIKSTMSGMDAIAPADYMYTTDYSNDKTGQLEVKEEEFFGYGGDWGETVTDNDFCGNGLVNADRTPSAELNEVKKAHQEVSFYDDGKANTGEVRVVNEFLNTNLNEYNINWTLSENNEVIGSGSLTEDQKNIAAQSESTIKLADFPKVSATKNANYILNLSVTLKEDQSWAGLYGGHEGQEIAFEEFELGYKAEKPQPVLDAGSMDAFSVDESSENEIIITGTTAKAGGKPFEIKLDKTTGYISGYSVDGNKILESGPVPNYWRAKLSNDPAFTDAMKNAADTFRINSEGITVNKSSKSIVINVPGTITGLSSANNIDYTIYANGDIVVTNTFTPATNTAVSAEIARIGMKMEVPAGYENISYYGKGPDANYVDRNTGSKMGIYKSTVTERFENKIIKPQENGNRTGVRWTTLTNDQGQGIMVTAENEMESGALHYKAEDLARYKHPYQVPQLDSTILTVDLMQRGLGNASCGPGPLGQYLISSGKTYTHTFRISPLTGQTTDKELMKKSETNFYSNQPLSGLTVNGKEVDGFVPTKSIYNYQILEGTFEEGSIPQVDGIKMSDDIDVQIEQPTAIPGTATVTATSPFGTTSVYTLNITSTPQIYSSDMTWAVDKGGYYVNARDKASCGAGLVMNVNGAAETFTKGIGVHAPSEIGINIEGKDFTTFEAFCGIDKDQAVGGPAEVNFVIKADGREIFRKDNVKAGTKVPVKVNVSKKSNISLITEMGERDANDHALWADAKFTHKADAVDVKVTNIELTPKKTSINPGEISTITTHVTPADATDPTVTFTSSDKNIITVDEETGTFTGVATGEATITATANDGSEVKGTCTINVVKKKVPVETITLTAADDSIKVGGTTTVTAAVTPEDADNKEVVYDSMDTTKAVVDPQTGIVTGKSVGEATIRATAVDGSKVVGICTIEITKADPVDVPVTSITLTPDKDSIAIGESIGIGTVVMPGNATNDAVMYESSDFSIAEVDTESGMVTGIAAGTVTITATALDGSGVTGSCTITVTEDEFIGTLVEEVIVTPKDQKLKVNDLLQMAVSVLPENADNKNVTWKSDDTAIAKVDAAGKVTAVAVGTTTISAVSRDGSNKSGSCIITVEPANIPVSKITVNVSAATLNVGQTGKAVAVVEPVQATNKEVTWAVSDGSVLSVDASGNVYAKKAGKATVTATAKDGSRISGSAQITVVTPPPAVIKVTKVTLKPSKASLGLGSSVTIKASTTPANSTVKGVKFTTSNKKVATVSSGGKVTAKGIGTATITVISKDNNAQAKFTVTVNPKKVTLKKVEKASSKSIKATWKKASGVTGYKVYVSTKKNSGYKLKATIKNSKTTSTVIKKLASKKTYYVKVAAYKKVGKKTYTSDYSAPTRLKLK